MNVSKKQKIQIKKYTTPKHLMIYTIALLVLVVVMFTIQAAENSAYDRGFRDAEREAETEKISKLYGELGLTESLKLYAITLLVKVPDVLVYFVIVSIPIAWIVHGFGFIIMRGK